MDKFEFFKTIFEVSTVGTIMILLILLTKEFLSENCQQNGITIFGWCLSLD